MRTCTSPEDIFPVLLTVWPPLPFAGILVLIVAGVLLLTEGLMRFRFGGIPDGLLGMLGLTGVGVAMLVWASTWPAGCAGTVSATGWVVLGLGALLTLLVFLFWMARRRDGGMLLRHYGDGQDMPQ